MEVCLKLFWEETVLAFGSAPRSRLAPLQLPVAALTRTPSSRSFSVPPRLASGDDGKSCAQLHATREKFQLQIVAAARAAPASARNAPCCDRLTGLSPSPPPPPKNTPHRGGGGEREVVAWRTVRRAQCGKCSFPWRQGWGSYSVTHLLFFLFLPINLFSTHTLPILHHLKHYRLFSFT